MDRVSDTDDASSDSHRKNQPQQRKAFIDEALRIEDRHQDWADAQNTQGAWWRRWNTLITVAAAILAAASGGAGLASETFRTLAGIAALVAAVLTAMVTAFGTSSRSAESFEAAMRNQVLADRARSFRVTIAPFAPLGDVEKKFDKLIELRDETTLNSQLRLGVRTLRVYRRASRTATNPGVDRTGGAGHAHFGEASRRH